MVRYIMSFSVPEGREQSAQKIIDGYFNALQKHGPGGMRSQCYADYDEYGKFVHIKSFKKNQWPITISVLLYSGNISGNLQQFAETLLHFLGCSNNRHLNLFTDPVKK